MITREQRLMKALIEEWAGHLQYISITVLSSAEALRMAREEITAEFGKPQPRKRKI